MSGARRSTATTETEKGAATNRKCPASAPGIFMRDRSIVGGDNAGGRHRTSRCRSPERTNDGARSDKGPPPRLPIAGRGSARNSGRSCRVVQRLRAATAAAIVRLLRADDAPAANRDNSTASRFSQVGFVPPDNIVGQGQIIFYSVYDDERAWQFWRWPFAGPGYSRFLDEPLGPMQYRARGTDRIRFFRQGVAGAGADPFRRFPAVCQRPRYGGPILPSKCQPVCGTLIHIGGASSCGHSIL